MHEFICWFSYIYMHENGRIKPTETAYAQFVILLPLRKQNGLMNYRSPVTWSTCYLHVFLRPHNTSSSRRLHKILLLCEDDQGRSSTLTVHSLQNNTHAQVMQRRYLHCTTVSSGCSSKQSSPSVPYHTFFLAVQQAKKKKENYWCFVKDLQLRALFVNLLFGRNTKAHTSASESPIRQEARGQPISMLHVEFFLSSKAFSWWESVAQNVLGIVLTWTSHSYDEQGFKVLWTWKDKGCKK